MAKLLIHRLGKEFAQLDLIEGEEYILGRSQSCAVELLDEKGISRQHLRIYFNGATWAVELLSRFGSLLCDGAPTESIELTDQASFSVPPYEFLYLNPLEKPQGESKDFSEKSLVLSNPFVPTQPEGERSRHTAMTSSSPTDATSSGVSSLVPYLKVGYADHSKNEVIRLEGQLWVAGREASCEITLDDHHVSRRHFELAQTQEGYFITDLNSANGTLLNGMALPPGQPHQLQSGDKISIMDVHLDFEVRDTQFEQKLRQATKNLPALQAAPPLGAQVPAELAYEVFMAPRNSEGPNVIKVETHKKFGKISLEDLKQPEFYKRNKIRILIGLLIPFFLIGLFSEEPKKTETQSQDSSSTSITFQNMTEEQKTAIKDSFQLATNLYVQAKYELCLAELKKLHELIPQYENSKELYNYCEHGSQLVRENEYKRHLKEQQQEIERQIQLVTEECAGKVNPRATMAEIQSCLGPASELSPEHPLVVSVLEQMRTIEAQKEQEAQAAQARRIRINEGRRHYSRAKSLENKGRLSAAIKEYQRFLNSGYPGLNQEESMARRNLASVQKELDQKVGSLMETCQSAQKDGRFKEAYKACEAAKAEDPGNKEAQEGMDQAVNSLRRNMKTLYEDSVIEESLGNVDAAKQKWEKIKASDLENGEYYKKASSKLKRYGSF